MHIKKVQEQDSEVKNLNGTKALVSDPVSKVSFFEYKRIPQAGVTP